MDQPRRMGHEYAGIVEEVGPAVTTIKPRAVRGRVDHVRARLASRDWRWEGQVGWNAREPWPACGVSEDRLEPAHQ